MRTKESLLTLFADVAITKSEQKTVLGGDAYAYCTTGNNAMCYRYVDDASLACRNDDTCTHIEALMED